METSFVLVEKEILRKQLVYLTLIELISVVIILGKTSSYNRGSILTLAWFWVKYSSYSNFLQGRICPCQNSCPWVESQKSIILGGTSSVVLLQMLSSFNRLPSFDFPRKSHTFCPIIYWLNDDQQSCQEPSSAKLSAEIAAWLWQFQTALFFTSRNYSVR